MTSEGAGVTSSPAQSLLTWAAAAAEVGAPIETYRSLISTGFCPPSPVQHTGQDRTTPSFTSQAGAKIKFTRVELIV